MTEYNQAHRSWLVGRAQEADIHYDRGEVSQRHCVLTEYPEGFAIADLGSASGTYVNGDRLPPNEPRWVSPTDDIRLGGVVQLAWPSREAAAPASGVIRRTIRIGRDPESDIQLDFPAVSWEHARLLVMASGEYVIEDAGSTNGTFLNRYSNRVQRANVGPGDEILFGTYRMPVARLLEERKLNLGASAGSEVVQFSGERWVVGRDPSCDFAVNDPSVSWRHAEFVRANGKIRVRDLGSRNGTYVNGRPISGEVLLDPGAEVVLGRYRFALQESGALERQEFRGNVTIEANGVCIEGKRNGTQVTLLDSVSLTVFPSEFVALMGTSGAGKTTLMQALIGISPVPAGKGKVSLNGRDLNFHYDEFRHLLGYVPQDDIIHPDLTVEEALGYTARLRTDLTESEVQERITRVLSDLELTGKRKDQIGTPENKILSGGERKRVNIAMELISDPDVLLLDEPISGLSSEDSVKLISLLRRLANGDKDRAGKTIIASIHQPSLELFRMFDNVIVIARDKDAYPGHLAYYGPAYPQSLEFFNQEGVAKAKREGQPPSPELLLQGAVRKKAGDWRATYESTEIHKRFVNERAGTVPALPGTGSATQRRRFNIGQFRLLAERTFVRKCRDRLQMAIQFLQALVFGLLLGLLFDNLGFRQFSSVAEWQIFASKVSMSHFMLVIASLWFGCSSAVRDIVGERAVYLRERMVSLKLPSYVLSKFVVNGLLGCAQIALLLVVVYPLSGLQADWMVIGGLLLLVLLTGVAMGLFLSAVAQTTESAIAMMPLVLLPMIILGGGLQPVWRMAREPIQVLAMAMPTRWAYEASVLREASARSPVALDSPCAAPVSEATDKLSEAYEKQLAECQRRLSIATKGVFRADEKMAKPEINVAALAPEDVATVAFPETEPEGAENWSKRNDLETNVGVLSGTALLFLSLTIVVLRSRDKR